MHLFDLLTIVCVVSMVGTEFTISAFIDPALAELDTGNLVENCACSGLADGAGYAFLVFPWPSGHRRGSLFSPQ